MMTPQLLADIMTYIFGTAFTVLLGTGVKALHDLSKSVIDLNRSMATVLMELGHHKASIDDHEERIREVENTD